MKIVPPSVKLLAITPNAEKLIELCGRVAYKSEDKITEDSHIKFIQMILKRGHEAVIEHASASLLFVCCRGCSHELVRHRIASYTQESTRFVNYSQDKFGNEISVIRPPGLEGDELAAWEYVCKCSETAYMAMIARGVKPQIARSILPTCLKTEIVATANAREWRHFFKMRCAKDAHPQMREVALAALEILHNECPTIFQDYWDMYKAELHITKETSNV